MPPPLFSIVISILQVAIYIYYSCTSTEETMQLKIIEGPLAFTPNRHKEVWRYLTYVFVHGR